MAVQREIGLRVTVVDPPTDIAYAMQRGRAELHQSRRSNGAQMSFDFTVRVGVTAGGALNFLGDFTQGPASVRFVYVNMGTSAGDPGSCWSRRAKIPLMGITPELIAALDATPGGVLEARYMGTAKDGGPTCASVKLLDGGWRVVEADVVVARVTLPRGCPARRWP